MKKMNIITLEVAGIQHAISAMRNPMNSWHLSDSIGGIHVGEKDLVLAKRLIASGGEHRKFLRSIKVWADISMPRYFWQEFDTYAFVEKNSTSTMHKLFRKDVPIKLDDFVFCDEDRDWYIRTIFRLNDMRRAYFETDDVEVRTALLLRAKRMLPEGFLQLRTISTNYEVLRNIYHQRKNHRLKEEWQDTFCRWVETLPYAEEFIVN